VSASVPTVEGTRPTVHEVLYSIDGQSMLDLLKQATSSLFGEMISLKDALLG